MSMSIGTVGGMRAGPDPSKMASDIATKMMKELDPANAGSVSKAQFVDALSAKGVSKADASKVFDAIDTKKAGVIGKPDLEAAIKSGKLRPPSGEQQGAGPGGPGGAPKSGGAGAAGGSTQEFEAADANKDGVVTSQEAALYAVSHPAAATTAKTSAVAGAKATTADSGKLGQYIDVSV